jgi:hypothetical protein
MELNKWWSPLGVTETVLGVGATLCICVAGFLIHKALGFLFLGIACLLFLTALLRLEKVAIDKKRQDEERSGRGLN